MDTLTEDEATFRLWAASRRSSSESAPCLTCLIYAGILEIQGRAQATRVQPIERGHGTWVQQERECLGAWVRQPLATTRGNQQTSPDVTRFASRSIQGYTMRPVGSTTLGGVLAGRRPGRRQRVFQDLLSRGLNHAVCIDELGCPDGG